MHLSNLSGKKIGILFILIIVLFVIVLLFYPPFGVIDFLGYYTPQYNDYTITNFADIYLYIFIILILFYPILVLIKKLYSLNKKNQSKQLPLDNNGKEVE